MQAPSAVNGQPWTFTVVRDQRLLDRISRDTKAHMLATMPAACVPIAPIILGHPKVVPPPVPRNEPQIHWIG